MATPSGEECKKGGNKVGTGELHQATLKKNVVKLLKLQKKTKMPQKKPIVQNKIPTIFSMAKEEDH